MSGELKLTVNEGHANWLSVLRLSVCMPSSALSLRRGGQLTSPFSSKTLLTSFIGEGGR